jgi:hypothetical protein
LATAQSGSFLRTSTAARRKMRNGWDSRNRSHLSPIYHRGQSLKDRRRLKPWETRGSIAGLRARRPSKRHLIDSGLALLVAELCDEIVRHGQENRFTNLDDCPQYRFLERLCYAAGFVAPDMALLEREPYQALLTGRTRIDLINFPDLRRFIHMLWRAERHSDVGDETGGAHVIDAARSGALTVVARIRELVKNASSTSDLMVL